MLPWHGAVVTTWRLQAARSLVQIHCPNTGASRQGTNYHCLVLQWGSTVWIESCGQVLIKYLTYLSANKDKHIFQFHLGVQWSLNKKKILTTCTTNYSHTGKRIKYHCTNYFWIVDALLQNRKVFMVCSTAGKLCTQFDLEGVLLIPTT